VSIVRAQVGVQALEGNDELFQEFLRRRDVGGGMPTDHLLNAMYLANSVLADDAGGRRRAARGLLDPMGSGEL
jgi:hypothetical protein